MATIWSGLPATVRATMALVGAKCSSTPVSVSSSMGTTGENPLGPDGS